MPDLHAALERAPRSLRRFAHRVAAGEGALGRIADRVRYPYGPGDIPRLPAAGGAERRFLIGPNNTAGQGYLWARAVERSLPGIQAVSVYGFGADAFRTQVDLRVPEAVFLRAESWHSDFEGYLASRTHVIWESGLPLLGRRYGMSVAREVAQLSPRGVTCGLLFHGSDIRPPSRHAAASRWSPFAEPTDETRRLEAETSHNATLAAELGAATFVSTPDLLRWLPESTWCPVVVDPSQWSASMAPRSGPPVVVHAPSNPWIKGTPLIEPTLRRLADEGVIEYRQLAGVPHAEIPAFYADADIVLDQFTLGSYGVAACEAMASGRLVMGHVDALARDEVRNRTGFELPIHETTPESLEFELRRYAADPDAFAAAQSAGPDFVAAVHDGRWSAAALAPFLGVSGTSTAR